MEKIRCKGCQTRLKLPSEYAGGVIQCPKCGRRFSSRPASPAPDESAASPATAPPNPQDEDSSSARQTEAGSSAHAPSASADATPGTSKRPSWRNPALLDFQFNRFLTPLIIKFSWVAVLLLTLLWILFLLLVYAGSFFVEGDTSAANALSGQGMGIEDILQGNGDVASLNNLIDSLTGGGAGRKDQSLFQRFRGFGFRTLSLMSLIVSLILSVAWCRVMFETIIAIFDISTRLKSIDEKTDPNDRPVD